MRIILALLIPCLLLISCSSGKKALERGDYYNATILAVNRLRGNPNSEKALQAVKESYPMSLDFFQSRIDNALNNNSLFKYSEVADYYEKVNHLSDEISRCPVALNQFSKLKYYNIELIQVRKLAAEEQYNAGLINEKLNTRLSWKDAYFDYFRANQFSSGYKDVLNRLGTAKFNATLRVVVEPVMVPRKYQLSSDFFYNQIIEHLKLKEPNEFVEFYTPVSADQSGIKVQDQVVKMDFDDFVVGQVYDKELVREVVRDSVNVGMVNLPDGRRVKSYKTVKAWLTINRRELISKGILDVSILDLSRNTVISEKKFPGQFVWSVEWGSYKGDERALSDKDLAICKHKPALPPERQDLFIEFTKPIYNQVTSFLKIFYKQY